MIINSKISRRYSTALYDIAEETNSIDKISSDLNDIRNSIDNSRELRLFLKSPVINTSRKQKTLKALFSGKVSDITMKFIDILCRKNRENYLHDISIDFHSLVNEKRNIIEAEIKTAITLSEDEKKRITDKLRQYTGNEIHPKFKIDKDIKGGFVAKIKDTIIDASIKRQLGMLKEQFRKGSFTNN